jgi:hypothetical protein
VTLAAFQHSSDLAAWNVFSDGAFGGASQAKLRLTQLQGPGAQGSNNDQEAGPDPDMPMYASFEGRVSRAATDELARSGFAGINTLVGSPREITSHAQEEDDVGAAQGAGCPKVMHPCITSTQHCLRP